MIIKLIRFPVLIAKLLIQGIGRIRIRKSCKMLEPAPTKTIACWLRHWADIALFQMEWTGRHWKATMKVKMTPWRLIKTIEVTVP